MTPLHPVDPHLRARTIRIDNTDYQINHPSVRMFREVQSKSFQTAEQARAFLDHFELDKAALCALILEGDWQRNPQQREEAELRQILVEQLLAGEMVITEQAVPPPPKPEPVPDVTPNDIGNRKANLGPHAEYDIHPDIQEPKAGDRIHKRVHHDGDAQDPYTLMADGKPLGANEGKMPSSLVGMEEPPTNHDALVAQGWPSLNAPWRNGKSKKDYANFMDAEPRDLAPGTRIYRIVDEKAGNAGGYWSYELPPNKTRWRKDFAVKDS